MDMSSAVNTGNRGKMVSEFNRPGSAVDVLIGTFTILSTGWNVHGDCHAAVLVGYYWNHPARRQALGRIYRVGQTRPCRVIQLHMDGYMSHELVYMDKKYVMSLFATGELPPVLRQPRFGHLADIALYSLVSQEMGDQRNRIARVHFPPASTREFFNEHYESLRLFKLQHPEECEGGIFRLEYRPTVTLYA